MSPNRDRKPQSSIADNITRRSKSPKEIKSRQTSDELLYAENPYYLPDSFDFNFNFFQMGNEVTQFKQTEKVSTERLLLYENKDIRVSTRVHKGDGSMRRPLSPPTASTRLVGGDKEFIKKYLNLFENKVAHKEATVEVVSDNDNYGVHDNDVNPTSLSSSHTPKSIYDIANSTSTPREMEVTDEPIGLVKNDSFIEVFFFLT